MKKRILLLSGLQGSGKSTQAKLVSDILHRHGHSVVTFKFAEIIYRLHDACLPILKSTGIRPGHTDKDGPLLQVLGTEYGRKCIGENVWVDATRRAVDDYINACGERLNPVVIIDDCRFENEFDAFPDALRVRLQCDREIRKQRCHAWRDNIFHPSETGLNEYESRGLFDLYLCTSYSPPEWAANQIVDRML